MNIWKNLLQGSLPAGIFPGEEGLPSQAIAFRECQFKRILVLPLKPLSTGENNVNRGALLGAWPQS